MNSIEYTGMSPMQVWFTYATFTGYFTGTLQATIYLWAPFLQTEEKTPTSKLLRPYNFQFVVCALFLWSMFVDRFMTKTLIGHDRNLWRLSLKIWFWDQITGRFKSAPVSKSKKWCIVGSLLKSWSTGFNWQVFLQVELRRNEQAVEANLSYHLPYQRNQTRLDFMLRVI